MSQNNIGTEIADQIVADFSALGIEAKRKNNEVKLACDHSIEITQPFASNSTRPLSSSEKELGFQKVARKHPEYITPILMACNSKNQKLIGLAIKLLSKFIQLQLLPDADSVSDPSADPIGMVVDALLNASNSTPEVQIKLLQLLPIFMQMYAFRINDDILCDTLFICSNLQSVNRSPVIINTSQATFSQMLNIVFEKLNSVEGKALEPDNEFEVILDNSKKVKIGQYSYDAQRIVSDLCALIEHHKPSFLKTNYLTEDYGFEVLESILKNNSSAFNEHMELTFLLRTRIVPILLRFLSSSKDFTLMVKVSRIILLILEKEFDVLKIESEVTLNMLTHILSKDSGAATWKKIIILEIFVALFRNPELIQKMFLEYDNNEKEAEKKGVISNFLSVCRTTINDSRNILNTGDLVQPPPSDLEPNSPNNTQRKPVHTIGLDSKDFRKVIKYIDSMDKQEPPVVPEHYNLFLILQVLIGLSDCIQSFTLSIMKATDPVLRITNEFFLDNQDGDLKKTYDSVNSLIQNTWNFQLDIIDVFVHSTVDNEIFSSSLKLLENLCYCSGMLSNSTVKHSVLLYLGKCTLKLDGTNGYKSRVMSIGESIVGTISSTFGSAVSNIASTQGNGDHRPTNSLKFYPRSINTRQTLCFHTLIRLAVSLGFQLDDDWKIVISVLQWISYYIDGPTGYNKRDVPSISQYLNNRDLQIINHSLTEFNKSIFNHDEQTFAKLIKTSISLSQKLETIDIDDKYARKPIDEHDEIQPCIFNKLFFVNKITDFSIINPIKCLILSEHNFDIINEYFSRIVNNRDYSEDVRLVGSRSLNQIIKVCADQGFEGSDADLHLATENKVFSNMCIFMEKLSELPMSKELLVANNESEIYLQTLDTLKYTIDKYGSLIVQSWVLVTRMLNFPFLIIRICDPEIQKERVINDNITSIIKSSFETLKVILDEMLQSIPKNQIKVIIDSLYNFVSQNFDLNISFNSVSYFWIISDFIKDKLESIGSTAKLEEDIETRRSLVNVLEDSSIEDSQYYQYLWIYLVLKLANTTKDDRIQVRNGSIITMFGIIESFLSEGPLVDLLYTKVLKPIILETETFETIKISRSQEQKEWMESFISIVTGMTKFFLSQTENKSFLSSENLDLLDGVLKYFIGLSNLDYNWIELNSQIFTSYFEILEVFGDIKEEVTKEYLEVLYQPWSLIKINYNFNNGSLYQNSLCGFVNCFSLSYDLFKPIMSPSKFEKMLMVLNSCIRYPILVDSRNDDKKCTNLQKVVLDNLAALEMDQSSQSFIAYESLLIQQLNVIVGLPFHTRNLIVNKLGDKGIRIPTFVAASYYGMLILNKHLKIIIEPKFFNERSILKITKALLEPTELKSNILVTQPDNIGTLINETEHDGDKNSTYLWMISFEMLTEIVVSVLKHVMGLSELEFKSNIYSDSFDQLVQLFLKAFDCCFIANGIDKAADDFNLKQYQTMKPVIFDFANRHFKSNVVYQLDSEDIEHIILSLWKSSFFYKHDIVMESIMPDEKINSNDVDELFSLLCNDINWDIYNVADNLVVPKSLKHSMISFNDLLMLTNHEEYPHISSIAIKYFMARCAYGLRKYNIDKTSLGGMPISSVQKIEIRYIVEGFLYLLTKHKTSDESTSAVNSIRSVYALLVLILPTVNDKRIIDNINDVCIQLVA